MKLKSLLFFLLIFFNINLFSQENFIFPVYPGCKKNQTNQELQDCFQKKLRFELLDNLGFNAGDYFEGNIDNDFVEILFVITKEGKIDKLSYTEESNPVAAKNFLKQIHKLSKYYNSKKKSFLPASQDGKPVDYIYRMKFKYDVTMSGD